MNKTPRPTDEEFDELKRKRDEAVRAVVAEVARKWGRDPSEMRAHVSGEGPCYCACPDGPCQHIWDGPEYRDDNSSSVTCSRCGAVALDHDMRCAP